MRGVVAVDGNGIGRRCVGGAVCEGQAGQPPGQVGSAAGSGRVRSGQEGSSWRRMMWRNVG